jgi:hypothetical protein
MRKTIFCRIRLFSWLIFKNRITVYQYQQPIQGLLPGSPKDGKAWDTLPTKMPLSTANNPTSNFYPLRKINACGGIGLGVV